MPKIAHTTEYQMSPLMDLGAKTSVGVESINKSHTKGKIAYERSRFHGAVGNVRLSHCK
jgi:hypothetical protein